MMIKKLTVFGKTSMLFLSVLIISGCFSRSKPAYMVEQYTLEYDPPVVTELNTINESLRIERFSVSQSFNSQAMVYRPAPLKLATYNYNRWRVNPGDMVTDYLLRDVRNAGIFRAVFSYHDTETPRFIIEGGVAEFLEVSDKNEMKVFLSLNIALLDTNGKEITEKVVFQKQYKAQEQIREHTPEAFAKGMSMNMLSISKQLIRDIHKGITARIQSRLPGSGAGN